MGHIVLVHRSQGPPRELHATVKPPASGISGAFKRRLWFLKEIRRNRSFAVFDADVLDQFRPDIILARQDAYCSSMATQAWKRRIPLVTFADAPVAYETRLFPLAGRWHPPGFVEWMERRVLARSKAIITISHPAKRRLEHYRLNVPIEVVPNGIDPTRFQSIDESARARTRAELGLGPGPVIGFLGTFRAFHGIDRLCELISALKHEVQIQWLFVGDGPEREALRQAAGSSLRCVFTGRIPSERVPAMLGAMDVALAPHAPIPGDFYFCPLKILEYAAAGCAIVASNQGDIPKLLDDGRAGLIVEDPGLAAWANAIRRLVNDRSHTRAWGEAARQWVLANLTWRHSAKAVERVLLEALQDRK